MYDWDALEELCNTCNGCDHGIFIVNIGILIPPTEGVQNVIGAYRKNALGIFVDTVNRSIYGAVRQIRRMIRMAPFYFLDLQTRKIQSHRLRQIRSQLLLIGAMNGPFFLHIGLNILEDPAALVKVFITKRILTGKALRFHPAF